MIRLLRCALALVGLVALAPPASADLLTLNYQGASSNPAVAFTLNGTGYTNFPTGPFFWTQNALPPNPGFPAPIATFCIEIDGTQPLPPMGANTTFSVVTPAAAPTIGNNPAKIAAITELYGRFYQPAWASNANLADSAAFQVALWELVYDTGRNLKGGDFVTADLGAVDARAQQMLNGLTGDTSAFQTRLGGYELVALLAPGAGAKSRDEIQDQLILRQVPAPPGAVLAGIGFVAVFARARRVRRPA